MNIESTGGTSQISELIQEDMSGIALIKIYAQEQNERRASARTISSC